MSADDTSADTPKVGEALVAALGFEPTDGSSPAADDANGSVRSAYASNGGDVIDSAAPPKGTVRGAKVNGGAIGSDEPTGESPRVVSEADMSELDSALGDLDPVIDGRTAVADAGETIRVSDVPNLFDADSSGVHPVEVPTSSDPVADLRHDEQVNGKSSGAGTVVASSRGAVADVVDAIVPTTPPLVEQTPLAEQPPSPLQIPVPSGPITPDEAIGGATIGTAVAGGVAARQADIGQQSIGDRVTDAASRLPQILEDGFRQRPRRVKARKVRRVVRHVDPWSMLTFSVLFHLCVFAALLLASVLVWNAALAAGTIENIEDFIRDLGDYQTYEINGDVVFRSAMIIAGILTLASSLLVVLLTVVFNLISDLVGGIRVTVIEEETVRVRRRSNQ